MKKKIFAWFSVPVLVIGLFITVAKSGGHGKNVLSEGLAEPVYPAQIDEDDFEAWSAYREENRLSEEFLLKHNLFACKTADALFKEGRENVVYSPVSLYYALSLAASGTSGETAEELCRFLEVDNPEANAVDAGKLYRSVYADEATGELKIYTSLWQDNTLRLKTEFLNRAAKDFYSSVHQVDFNSENTAVDMGQWVARQTKGTISPTISIEPSQVLSILNTIYYYDEWQDHFQKDQTKPDRFYPEKGGAVTVDFMNRKFGSHSFARGENYTRSELYLKGQGYMVFVLPDEGTSLKELTDSPSALLEALEGGEEMMGEVTFKLPKFTVDSDLNVRQMMERLGVRKLFSDGDFSAMTNQKNIMVNAIKQNTHISINENGVEASAFTDIQYVGAALPKGKADMFMDRPFLFGIKANGVCLFLGVCYNP